MAGRFEARAEGGAAIVLDELEISILRSLTVQLLELIGPGEPPDGDADPLARLFAQGPSEPPADPVLARLFPDAYGEPGRDRAATEDGGRKASHDDSDAAADRAAAAEFRRYTEPDLRAGKRADALAVVHALDALGPVGAADGNGVGGAVLELSPEVGVHWLRALNDLRLAIGTRLEIREEDNERLFDLDDADPRKPMVMAYLWLGSLQETLVGTLLP